MEEEKINELIVKYLDNSISGYELDGLMQWIKEDPLNFRYFTDMKDIWLSCEMMAPDEKTEKALARFSNTYPEYAKSVVRPKRIIRLALQVAATLLMAFLLSYSWHWLTGRNEIRPIEDKGYAQVYIPRGQKGQITLNDGTRIWLNSNSVLKYPSSFGKGFRKVILDGEAYLEVHKDPAHPFLVETSSVTLKVLGTTFNVKSYSTENTVETTLLEGSLEILSGNSGLSKMKKVTLKPNEMAIFQKVSNEISVDKLDNSVQKVKSRNRHIEKSPISISQIESIVSWKDNHLIFRDESFEEIAKKMDAWYGVEIRIEDESLKNYRFTGKFIYNEPIEQVMEVISRTTPLQYSLNKNVLIIKSK